MRSMETAYQALPKLWSRDNITIIQGQMTLVHSVFDEFRRVLDSNPSLQRVTPPGYFPKCQVLLQHERYQEEPNEQCMTIVDQLAVMARPILATLYTIPNVTFHEMIQLLNLRNTRLDGKTYWSDMPPSPPLPIPMRRHNEVPRQELQRTPTRSDHNNVSRQELQRTSPRSDHPRQLPQWTFPMVVKKEPIPDGTPYEDDPPKAPPGSPNPSKGTPQRAPWPTRYRRFAPVPTWDCPQANILAMEDYEAETIMGDILKDEGLECPAWTTFFDIMQDHPITLPTRQGRITELLDTLLQTIEGNPRQPYPEDQDLAEAMGPATNQRVSFLQDQGLISSEFAEYTRSAWANFVERYHGSNQVKLRVANTVVTDLGLQR